MKKLIIGIGITLVGISAIAQNLYQQVKYVPIVPPASIGVSATTVGATDITTKATASNVLGVAVSTYPGTGAMLLNVNCGSGAGGIIRWQSYSTTNIGTAGSYTNGTWVASSSQDTYDIAWTNVVTNAVVPFVCNRERGYVKGLFTATGVTNGSVSQVLVTVPK